MKRFALTIAALALIASTSQACPFGRRAKCSSTTVTYVQVSNVQTIQKTEAAPVVAPVKAVIQAAAGCANGQCDSGRLQVGPSRGFFRLFR
jgi:hypothetical protein